MLSPWNMTDVEFRSNLWTIYLEWDHSVIINKLNCIFGTLTKPRNFASFQPPNNYAICGQIYLDFLLNGFQRQKYWKYVSHRNDLTHEELLQNKYMLNWKSLSKTHNFTPLSIETFEDRIDFSELLFNKSVDLQTKKQYIHKYNLLDLHYLQELALRCLE